MEELTEELSGAAEEGYFHTGGVDRLLKQTLEGGYRLMVNRRRDGRAGAAVAFTCRWSGTDSRLKSAVNGKELPHEADSGFD